MKRIFLILVVPAILVLHGCESPGPKQDSGETSSVSPEASDLSALDQSLYSRALDSLDADNAKSAAKQLARLEKKNPHHTGIKVNLATALYQQNQLDDAQSIISEALRLNGKVAALQNIAGLVAVAKKQFKDAEAYYLKALQLDNTLADAHYNIALLYDQYFQDIPSAYKHYQTYLKSNPNDTDTVNWVEQLKYSLD